MTEEIFNPFENDVVTDAWLPVEAEIESINKKALEVCFNAYKKVIAMAHSETVLLYGPAGSGKSHVLNRLRRWVFHADQLFGQEAIFVYINCGTSRKYALAARTTKILWMTCCAPCPRVANQLKRIIANHLADANEKPPKNTPNWWLDYFNNLSGGKLPELKILEKLFDNHDVEREVCRIIKHLLIDRHHPIARSWLRGENLPEEDLKKIGLTSDPGEVDPEYKSRQIVYNLLSSVRSKAPGHFFLRPGGGNPAQSQ